MRKLVLICALSIAAAVPVPASAATRLPHNASIAGIDVGGLGPVRTLRKLHDRLDHRASRRVAVRIGSRSRSVPPAAAGYRIDFEQMMERAFSRARNNRSVKLSLDYEIDKGRLGSVVSKLGSAFHRTPRNARVKFGITKVKRVRGRHGRRLDAGQLHSKLLGELRRPTRHRAIHVGLRLTSPAVTINSLARRNPTYVSVDRGAHKLRLFKRLRKVKTYSVAVGQAGHETPQGLRHVQSKQVDPAWAVPNRPWAGALAGQTIPPGDPRNPLKARFIALGDGIGIHGTAEDWSIGTNASHGCIRMHVSDVTALFPRVPVGAPVRIR